MPGKNKSFQSFISLRVLKIQALNSKEILDLIPSEILREIKRKDPHPFFQAYSIAHEGTSNPKILPEKIGNTEKQKPIHWTRKAIQSIKNIITRGVKFFSGHNKDNTTKNRRVLGEVITDLQKEIDGILHHVVISYHGPDVREEAKQCDICSQEAKWNLFENVGGFLADTIEKLTGITLASSKNDTPAFEGAKRLGMIQALEIENNKPGVPGKGEKRMSELTREDVLNSIAFHEVEQVLKRLNCYPSDVFPIEKIKEDRKLTVFQDLETLKEKNTTLENNNKNLVHDNLKANAEKRFKALLSKEDFQVTEKQKEFLNSFTVKDFEDMTEEGLLKFRNKELDNFKRITSVIAGDAANVEINDNTPAKTSSSTDYTKAENNEFLDEDL